MTAFLRSYYLTPRFFVVVAGLVVAHVAAFFVPALALAAEGALVGAAVCWGVDTMLLYGAGRRVEATRETPRRFSNGDDNEVRIRVGHAYRFPVRATVIDELPEQLQVRDAAFRCTIPPDRSRTIRYTVRPTTRGAYTFGAVNVYAATPLGLVERRYRTAPGAEVPVYPSFLQMRRYGLLAASNRLEEVGVKKVRRVGHTMEFDHIRPYVVGDDYRTINWKATARRGTPMVNQYRDERAQPVYCVINTGRVMRMPFEGLTLLDYSINASLVLANIALQRQDHAGLITFAHEVGAVVPAARRSGQLQKMQERLFRLDTDFLEADYARLAAYVQAHVRRRSLLLLFTNFTARSSMERYLPYLQQIARRHPLVVVFFENTELKTLAQSPAGTVEGIYVQTIAEKFAVEAREVTRALQRAGMYAVYTPPRDLSVQTINAYLELKARGVI